MWYHASRSSLVFLSLKRIRSSYSHQVLKRYLNDHKITEITQNIKRETKISRDHLTPELALHLITSECPLFHAPSVDDDDNVSRKIFTNDPFWAFYWPGGQALSRYILDNVKVVENKTVLDLGSGCGASSLAAVLSGAQYAVANDIDEAAGIATYLNADLNNIPRARIKINSKNIIGSSPIFEDIILLGDIFYDEEFAEILIPWLKYLRNEGKTILVGDPGRHGLTEQHLTLLKKLTIYELTKNCCIENNGFRFVNIWSFK